ncbi:MAG: hypothetical protein NTU60_13175 [Candidatus Aminicenantes bacterium]|nr:hypothetical protein [Candidatus Aminicenantes bacterium]
MAAALLLPPPNPRPAGIFFSTRMPTPRETPARARRLRTAREIRFVSSQGILGSFPSSRISAAGRS